MAESSVDLPEMHAKGAPRFRAGWTARLIASPGFQKWAAGFWPTRRLVRRDGEALFELLSGFCQSQILMALVQFDIPQRLLQGPMSTTALSDACGVPVARMHILLRAATALDLLKQKRGEVYSLSRKGAALAGVPGLDALIRHHDILYRDLENPAAFFRGETSTELAGFWPYVFGGEIAPDAAATYTDLMAQSLELVAEDTLRSLSLKGVTTLLDVGGGSGAFLEAVGKTYPALNLMLFDLPQVAPTAQPRFAKAGLESRASIKCGSFLNDPIPDGADGISLIRVLYDHNDETCARLLSKCCDSLPKGGRLFVSEPMTGDKIPDRAGDVYFALYTLAMQTGKARSASEISALCSTAGFEIVATPTSMRPFVTSCLEARKK